MAAAVQENIRKISIKYNVLYELLSNAADNSCVKYFGKKRLPAPESPLDLQPLRIASTEET
jgi:hypothetical protein